MTSKIKWVEGVTKYNHITIACSKITINSKVFKCIQKLDRRKWKIIKKPFQNIQYPNPKVVAT